MLKVFEKATDVTDVAAYRKTIKTTLPKIGKNKTTFTYFDKFEFASGGAQPALIVGAVEKSLLTELTKKGKGPAKGTCTFSPDSGLELRVKKGVVDQEKLGATLKKAGVTCDVAVIDGKDDPEDEVELGAVQAGLKSFGKDLEDHLTGRMNSDRDADALAVVQMGEDVTNASKSGSEPHAHSISAHGPGTDQRPRVLAGYRADEVAQATAAGSLPANMTLTGSGAGPDAKPAIEMPAFATVGSDPSKVSSQFASGQAMLATVKEAFAQAALIEGHIANELKEAADDRAVLGQKPVADALKALVEARKALDAKKKELTAAQTGAPDTVAELAAAVGGLSEVLEKASKAFIAEKKTAMDAQPKPEPTELGNKRMGIEVSPGMVTGSSTSTTSPGLKEGRPLTADKIQERYDNMTVKDGLQTARVVLDPAFVTDNQGNRRRAGWQAQTAFPTDSATPQENVSAKDFKVMKAQERFDKADTVVKAAEKAVIAATKAETAATTAITKAQQLITTAQQPGGNAQKKAADLAKAQTALATGQTQLAAAQADKAKAEGVLNAATAARTAADTKLNEAKAA